MRADWQDAVGRSWAAMWRETDRSFAGLTARLAERLSTLPGEVVADIGCGAGELSLALAPHRRLVTGVDVSAELVAVARERAQGLENVRFAVADAARWVPGGEAPDLFVSRHGVMFFDNPAAAFGHFAAIAAPGARLAFSCFRAAADNPWASGVAALLGEGPPANPHAPGPFAFAEPDHVRRVLAGWTDVSFEPVDFAYVAGAGDEPVDDAMRFLARIGPAARAMRELPDDRRIAFAERLRAWLAANRHGNEVRFPAAAWIVTARRA